MKRPTRWAVVGMGVGMILGLPVAGRPANISNDQVLSQHIKEADGTSGQDTNSGSGVKAGHIQDGAVTDAKITGPISAGKLQQGSGSGLNADTVDGVHASGFAASTHAHDDVYQKKYGKVAVVAVSGAEYSNPVAAMADLATWCGTPSASSPCLLKIMPGVYDIGPNGVRMQEFVDVEGSGTGVTRLTGAIAGEYPPTEGTTAVVVGASNAEIRSLTIENTWSGDVNFGILNQQVSFSMRELAVYITGGSQYAFGVGNNQCTSPVIQDTSIHVVTNAATAANGIGDWCSSTLIRGVSVIMEGSSLTGIYSACGSALIRDTRVSVSGGVGVQITSNSSPLVEDTTIWTSGSGPMAMAVMVNASSEPTFTNVNAFAPGSGGKALYLEQESGKTIRIDRSTLMGGSYSIFGAAYCTAQIGASKLVGPIYFWPTFSALCAGVYNGNYVSLGPDCR